MRGKAAPVVRVRGVWIKYGAAVLVYAFVLHLLQVQHVPADTSAAAIAVFAVCLFPLAYWFASGRPGPPMFELICLSYGIQYSPPVYLQPNSITINSRVMYLSWQVTTDCLVLVVAGLGAMILAYYTIQRLLENRKLPTFALIIEERAARPYVLISFAAAILANLLGILGQSPDGGSAAGWALRIMSFQAYGAIALLTIWYYTGTDRNVARTVLLFGGASALALLGLLSGFIESAVVPPLIMVIVYWQIRRRFPVRVFAAGLLVFLLISSVKSDYRNQVWSSNQSVSIPGRASVLLSLVQQRWEPQPGVSPGEQIQTILAPTTARLDLIHVFAWIHANTPYPVPYFGGSTYSYLLYGWVPRVVLPDKPSSSAANIAIESAYGLLLPFQLPGATIGVGHVGEAFANFGGAGVVIVMGLFGIAFAVFRRLLAVLRSNCAWAAYVAVLVVFLNGIGSYTSIVVIGAVENALVTMLLLTFFARRSRAQAAPSK